MCSCCTLRETKKSSSEQIHGYRIFKNSRRGGRSHHSYFRKQIIHMCSLELIHSASMCIALFLCVARFVMI